tara:strand:+ start:51 stop:359 length:309 start_codon:yes stop_codon:yes gene_type:complete
MNKNIILYGAILIFGIAAPFIFPAFKVQLSILCILIILAITWNVQGGEMGYNTFGNILFYGLGMYLCASVQVGMFFPLGDGLRVVEKKLLFILLLNSFKVLQ